MKRDIMEDARGRWHGILPQLGISPTCLTGKHGPCPMCGGRDRFRFDNKGGDGTYICNQCGAGNGIRLAMLKTGMQFKDCAARVRELAGIVPKQSSPPSDRGALDALVSRIWREGIDIASTQGAAYLADRGLEGEESTELRFHPRCALSDVPGHSHAPALLALVRDAKGEPCAISRLYLDGVKKARWIEYGGTVMASRKFIGSFPKGAAIRLHPPEGGRLGIAEGYETALAVRRLRGAAVWAVLNTTMMEDFVLPGDITRFGVFGDNDPLFGGQKAAFTIAHKVAVKNRDTVVTTHLPPKVGTDWLDILNGAA